MTGLFIIVIFGVVVGWLVSNFTEGRGLNLGMSILVGIIGSFAGGLLGSSLLNPELPWSPVALMFTPVVGAIILLVIVNLIKKFQ